MIVTINNENNANNTPVMNTVYVMTSGFSYMGMEWETKSRRIYTVSQKTVQICFCQNFVKFPPNFDKIWQKDGKEAKIIRGVHLT